MSPREALLARMAEDQIGVTPPGVLTVDWVVDTLLEAAADHLDAVAAEQATSSRDFGRGFKHAAKVLRAHDG